MGICIEKVKIANFRAIKQIEVSLRQLTVLVGANNTGKTTFLRALHLALGEGRKVVSREDFHIENGKFAEEIVIDICIVPIDSDGKQIPSFDEPWFPGEFNESNLSLDNNLQSVIIRTRIKEDTNKSNGYSFERCYLKKWDETPTFPSNNLEGNKFTSLESIPLYFIDAQRDIVLDIRDRYSFFGKLVSRIKFDKNGIKKIEKMLADLNSSIIEKSKILKHIGKTLKDIQNVLGTDDTQINVAALSPKIRDIGKGLNILLQEGNGESLALDYHGVGTRSWASLLTLKAFIDWETNDKQTNDEAFYPVLALEEPESHLHPNAQRQLLAQMTKMGGQKIISTHSPFIAATCQLASIRHFYKSGEETKIGHINDDFDDEARAKIQREIMNTRGELLYAKCIVLCEGSSDEQMLPIFARKFWLMEPFEKGICFVGTGGGKNYEVFIRFCIAFNIPWFIFGDADRDIPDKLNGNLQKLKLPHWDKCDNIVLMPNGQNIEQYLLSEGYVDNLRNAIIEKELTGYTNPRYEDAKRKEWVGKSEEEVKKEIDKNKTKIAPYIAEEILKCDDDKKIPPVFRELFDKINTKMQWKQTDDK